MLKSILILFIFMLFSSPIKFGESISNDSFNMKSNIVNPLQFERLTKIKEACQELKLLHNDTIQLFRSEFKIFYLRNFIFNKEHKFLMPTIPKVASNHWILFNVKLAYYGKVNDSNVKNYTRDIERPRKSKYKNNFRVDELEDLRSFNEKWNDYRKLLVVRHPFSRLVSFYLSNFGNQIIPN